MKDTKMKKTKKFNDMLKRAKTKVDKKHFDKFDAKVQEDFNKFMSKMLSKIYDNIRDEDLIALYEYQLYEIVDCYFEDFKEKYISYRINN